MTEPKPKPAPKPEPPPHRPAEVDDKVLREYLKNKGMPL